MKYRQQRNKVNSMIKFLKEEYICNLNDTLTEYHYNDQKSYWKIVRTLIKGTKPSYSIPSLFQNDTVAFTSEDKCDLLNNYFCSVTDLDNRDKDLPRFDDRTDATMTNVIGIILLNMGNPLVHCKIWLLIKYSSMFETVLFPWKCNIFDGRYVILKLGQYWLFTCATCTAVCFVPV